MNLKNNHLRLNLLPAIIVLLIGLLNSASILAVNWPKFGFNNEMTSYNPREKKIKINSIKQLEMKWGIGYNDSYFSVIYRCPAIYKNKLYTSKAGGRLSVYKAVTGKLLWEFGNGNDGWAPQPVVSKNIVYYMEETNPTYLYAVNVNTGKQIWKAPIGFELGYSGAAEAVLTIDEARKAIYLVENKFGGDGKLYALSTATGQVLWYKSNAKDGMAFRGNYVLLKQGKIYGVAHLEKNYSTHDYVASIDAANQKILRYYDRPQPEEFYEISDLLLCGNFLIVTYADRDDVFASKGIVVAYNKNSEKILWKKEFTNSPVTGSIAADTKKKILYIPTNPYLYAVKVKTGSEIWTYTGYSKIYSPSLANGIIYFISDTNMYAINAKNKKLLMTYPLGYDGGSSTQVAVCNGMVYFSGNGGTADLFALGLSK